MRRALALMVVLGLTLNLAGCAEQSVAAAPGASGKSTRGAATADLGLAAAPDSDALSRCNGEPVMVAEYSSIATSSGPGRSCRAARQTVPWKSGALGSPCSGPLDCAPTCCECSNAARSALTSWCDHGKCASPNAACCALAGTPTRSCGTR